MLHTIHRRVRVLSVDICYMFTKAVFMFSIGIAVPFDADENFQQRLDELTALLNRQVDIYSRERRTLEV